MNKISKLLVVVGLMLFSTVAGYAGTRNYYMVPVNQTGTADSFALPCVTSALVPAENTAVTVYGVGKSTPLAEAGMIYWLAITPATAGDYVVLRDSATANATSTPLITVEAPTITATTMINFNPPIAVTNGLSINVSSATTGATVCFRAADGDL